MAKPLKRPREKTVRRLFAVSANRCAFPGCTTLIISPTGTIVADVCHIKAQSPKGPRYDAAQDPDDRHGFDNLVILCKVHHTEIDADDNLAIYTVEKLHAIKRRHELEARESGISAPELSPEAVQALLLTTTTYESGSVHWDFRDAIFKVGGEGGHFGGGGGQGGVLTIVGIGGLPPDFNADLDGGHGQAPGGGGGGGGVVRFEGRAVRNEDLSDGLRISNFFTANAANMSGALLNVLGGAWANYSVPKLPFEFGIVLVIVIECGDVQANTLLRFDVASESPTGRILELDWVDVKVSQNECLVKRDFAMPYIRMTVYELGIHTLYLKSNGITLAKYQLEIKLI